MAQFSFGNPVVAEMNEPLVTKESRENMHDTKSAYSSLSEEQIHRKALERLYDCFADTFSEYLSSPYYEDKFLSVNEVYSAFMSALTKELDWYQNVADRAKNLKDLLDSKS